MTQQKFGLIVADPPWSFNDTLQMSEVKRGAEDHYDTLDADAIVRLAVKDIAEDNAVLALWFPSSLLSEAYCAMDHWGFKQRQIWDWVKTSVKEPYTSELHEEHDRYLWEEEVDISEDLRMAFGMGRLARNCSEHILVGVRGKVYSDLALKNVRNVFLAPNQKHSAKPEKVQDALELMFPTYSRIELFARRQRPDWLCVGLEAPETSGEDIRDTLKRLSGASSTPSS